MDVQRTAQNTVVGPGTYDPISNAVDKKSPSARFKTIPVSLEDKLKSMESLADIVVGPGNMANKVKSGRERIQKYFGLDKTNEN